MNLPSMSNCARALAQFQPPRDLALFWFDRFHHDAYIQYAHALFTGLRRSSLDYAARALPRLFDVASAHPEHFEPNRALRPLVGKLEKDKEAEQQFVQGFVNLLRDNQQLVIEAISDLELDVRKRLGDTLICESKLGHVSNFPIAE